MKFESKDYPSFFKTTDRYSIESQQQYMKWIKIELTILVVAGAFSLFPFDNTEYGRSLALLSAIVFTAGIAITFHIKNSKFEDDWYIGRALAESIKSLTWKYMINGEPFGKSLSKEEADKKFIGVLQDMFDENKSFLKVTYEEDDGVNITAKMREIRKSAFQTRKAVYIDNRVIDQQKWYKNKSIFNKAKASRLFSFIILLQVIALFYSFYLIFNPVSFNIPL